MRTAKSLALASTLFIATAALAGCGSSGPGDFTLVQQKPEIVEVDNGARGASKGDQTHFEAVVTKDGERAGIVAGELATRGLPNRFGRSNSIQIKRSELIFQLKDGDIVAFGLGDYPRDGWKLRAANPARRAIVGGTGKYAGVRGELVTVRQSDGTYEQQFNFSD